jgi:hypothetical protein
MDIKKIIAENERRKRALMVAHDVESGEGCSGERIKMKVAVMGKKEYYLPPEMKGKRFKTVKAWELERFKHDFEYWCYKCVTIKDKLSGKDIKMVLNRPQRRVVTELEKQRRAGLPIRMIMLKARQWGGSTLTQIYMAWIQLLHCRNWHSLICAHVKDTAATIRGMYSKLLDNYPEEYWEEDVKPAFKSYERAINIRKIAGRDCRVTIGSSENQDAVRGSDFAMAHLSEVAFWRKTDNRSPTEFIRAVCSGIALVPNSLIVLESTANGVGNYFHSEWTRSTEGNSDKIAVFVPWYEIDIYELEVKDAGKCWEMLTDYERKLWEEHEGITLEKIKWYHAKCKEFTSKQQMLAEFPSTASEAFTNSGNQVFEMEKIDELRKGCTKKAMKGELTANGAKGQRALQNIRFVADETGNLEVWQAPDRSIGKVSNNRYIVAVDVGGRSFKSDYSVIAVIDNAEEKPEVVAQWRGHIDHDLLAWKAATIAQWYNRALLVFESNTFESENIEGDQCLFILNQVKDCYDNLYQRVKQDEVTNVTTAKLGFHTNRATKTMIISNLIAAVRDGGYVERSNEACNEMAVYEVKPNGAYGAKDGCHDDVLMTRAIGLYIAETEPPLLYDFNGIADVAMW